MHAEAPPGCGRTEQRDEQEDQLACIHVAEESHAERHGLSDKLDDVQAEVGDPESGVRAKRSTEQFVDEASEALDLDVVVEHQGEDAKCHAHRAVQVGRCDDAEMGVSTEQAEDAGKQVDREEVHRVHQRDPDKDGQGHRRDKGAVAMNDVLRLLFDHFDNHLDEGLEAAGHAGGRFLRCAVHEEQPDYAHHHRPEDGVEVDHRKIDDVVLVGCLEVSEVMDDVF